MGGPDLIPIMGMLTGTVMMGFFVIGGVMLFRGPVGQALARRIQGKAGDLEQEMIAEVQALRDHVLTLEQTVGELEERLDFNERLLAQSRDLGAAQLGSPRQS